MKNRRETGDIEFRLHRSFQKSTDCAGRMKAVSGKAVTSAVDIGLFDKVGGGTS